MTKRKPRDSVNVNSEHWRHSPVFPDKYLISDKGEAYNIYYERLLKPAFRLKDGYCYFHLRNNNVSRVISVHRLVALAFIPNPASKPYVDHINGDKTDNKAENLRWVTAKENTNNLATFPRFIKVAKENIANYNKNRIVPVSVYKDGVLIKVFATSKEAADFTGVAPQNVSRCLHGKAKSSNGFTFKPIDNTICL